MSGTDDAGDLYAEAWRYEASLAAADAADPATDEEARRPYDALAYTDVLRRELLAGGRLMERERSLYRSRSASAPSPPSS